jgi:virulence-associated protein VagC
MKTNSLKATTRTFKSGNSIAVRIPHEFNLEAGKTFEIKRRGRELVLVERAENLGIVVDILQSMPADFFAEPLEDPPPEPVESFDMEPLAIAKPAAKRRKR